ncbi:MAG: thiamine phosphate synthase [candidate division WOR-3 bacterium]|nr:thiamine phosphate synthase [candidate division WOR-3 bacterium]MCX7836528.1 thiamine phosphate synthase [candidate division WOR-3 bacterium]MDW8113766.1 thiamine phosphate synthase [candidate division WOR-3 bacterium]
MVKLLFPKNRIIDVNFNRLREALKICEDILRFSLKDKELLFTFRKEVKKIRKIILKEEEKYLPFRNVKTDLGRKYEYDKSSLKIKDEKELLLRNLKRCQESCRILEEFYKIENEKISSFFKKERFFLYDFEKKIFLKFKKKLDLRVYPIIDIATFNFKKIKDYGNFALKLIKKGATILQLRAPKNFPTRNFILIGKEILKRIKKKNIKLIINDRVDVCLAINGDGVHLGKEDMPVKLAREILGEEKIIGKTIRSVKDLKKAEKEGVDYCSVGSIFKSKTKEDVKVVGIKTLKEILKKSQVPICAIGGIDLNNIGELIKLKIAGISFISAIKDIEKIAKIIKWNLKSSS